MLNTFKNIIYNFVSSLVLAFDIIKHIIYNVILAFIFGLMGILLPFIFYPLYFESYYCYFTAIFIIILCIFLIIKKRYLTLVYLINFLIFTSIFSYASYRSHFFTKDESKKILKQIEEQCKNEPEDSENINCLYYKKTIKK